jgi:hypothetical protein
LRVKELSVYYSRQAFFLLAEIPFGISMAIPQAAFPAITAII